MRKYELDRPAVKPAWYNEAYEFWQRRYGPGNEIAIRARLANVGESTAISYSRKWRTFEEDFCKPRNLQALPASVDTVCRYIGWQGDRGEVNATSMVSYLSAIGCKHDHFDLPNPCSVPGGPRGTQYHRQVQKTLDGLANLQGPPMRARDGSERLYLPASVPARILDSLLHGELRSGCRPSDTSASGVTVDVTDRGAVARFRDALALVFNYADFGRSDSSVGMTGGDIAVAADLALFFRFRRAKGRRRHKLNLSWQWPPDAHPEVVRLVDLWLSVRKQLGLANDQSSSMWHLPWENTDAGNTAYWRALFDRVLARYGVSAPGNFVYTPHSVRAGAASEAYALDVSLDKIRHHGGWAPESKVPRQNYIDPSCPPTPAGARFFGWLRPRWPPLRP